MVKRISRCAMIIALNTILGYVLKFFPNVKPATTLIILFAVYFSLEEAVLIAVGTALLQGAIHGFGTFVPFQILAWTLISLLAFFGKNVISKKCIIFGLFSAICGFVFGFICSLDILFIAGNISFITYYLNGLLFDLFHAFGNLIFGIIIYLIYNKYLINIDEMTKS